MQNFMHVSRGVYVRPDGDGRPSYQNRCRICLSPNTVGLVEIPCDCSGSIGFVHKICLRRWMHTVRNFNTCEICRERYEFAVYGPGLKTLLVTFCRRPLFKLLKFMVLLLLSFTAMNTIFISSFKVRRRTFLIPNIVLLVLLTCS